MINAIINAYRNRKSKKAIEETDFDFKANLEVPDPMQLQADIIAASPKPTIIVQPNDVAEWMASDNATSSLVAMDCTTLNRKLASDGLAWVPVSLLNMEILARPDLNVFILGGERSWTCISEDVKEDLCRLLQEGRFTIMKEDMTLLNLPLDTANQLWDLGVLWEVFVGFRGYDIEHFDKMNAAKLMAKRVPYLKRNRDVMTMRANVFRIGDGLYLNFI